MTVLLIFKNPIKILKKKNPYCCCPVELEIDSPRGRGVPHPQHDPIRGGLTHQQTYHCDLETRKNILGLLIKHSFTNTIVQFLRYPMTCHIPSYLLLGHVGHFYMFFLIICTSRSLFLIGMYSVFVTIKPIKIIEIKNRLTRWLIWAFSSSSDERNGRAFRCKHKAVYIGDCCDWSLLWLLKGIWSSDQGRLD